MLVFNFNNEEEFLNKFDGEIHAILDNDRKFLCDLLENDIKIFYRNNMLLFFPNGDIIITDIKDKYKILEREVKINIINK